MLGHTVLPRPSALVDGVTVAMGAQDTHDDDIALLVIRVRRPPRTAADPAP